MSLRLRAFSFDDEAAAKAAQKDFEGEGRSFLAEYDAGQTWTQWLELIVMLEHGDNIPVGHVPGAVLAADVDGTVVGRVSIRYELNEYLANRAGHIGYAVLREHRRKGYATEMLRQSLLLANDAGVNPVLVACDDDNVGSIAVIERCGGELESIGPDADGITYRRYWFSA